MVKTNGKRSSLIEFLLSTVQGDGDKDAQDVMLSLWWSDQTELELKGGISFSLGPVQGSFAGESTEESRN